MPRRHWGAGAALMRRSADVDARRDAEGAGLVDQEADAGARSALLIEGEPGLLVEKVVDEHGDIPSAVQETEAEVRDVIRRQFGIEGEGALGERTADRVGAKGIQVHEVEAHRL